MTLLLEKLLNLLLTCIFYIPVLHLHHRLCFQIKQVSQEVHINKIASDLLELLVADNPKVLIPYATFMTILRSVFKGGCAYST